MNQFTRSIIQVFQNALKAVETFPAANGSALCFALVTIVRIQLDWPQQEPYNFLFNCLHWAFAVGAVFSLAAITAAQSRSGERKGFLLANLAGIAVVILTFFMLYWFGKSDKSLEPSRYAVLSEIATMRAGIAILVSLLAFILFVANTSSEEDGIESYGISKAIFMTQKAFFIAAIYGGAIIGGTSGVFGAFQALLYRNMSGKVYMYLGTLAGLLAFMIFTGYFPDFRKGSQDERRELAEKQPKFIEILIGFILIPIMLALTVVMLMWAVKTVFTGTWPDFGRLAGIATSYAVVGIWLHMLVAGYETGLARFYRKAYPAAALVILVFEAWAIINQLKVSGMKIDEYMLTLIWIAATVSCVLLLVKQYKAHAAILFITCVLAVISVLPIIGQHALPVTMQTSRLERLLVENGMLKDGKLVPAVKELERTVKVAITDAVDYIGYQEGAKLPDWFDKKLVEGRVFKDKLGFDKTWKNVNSTVDGGPYLATTLTLPNEALDINEYRWTLQMQNYSWKLGGETSIAVTGDRGEYRVYWVTDMDTNVPRLRIELGKQVVLEKDMTEYLDAIAKKYPPGTSDAATATLKDLSYRLDVKEISVLLVFSNVEISLDPQADRINKWLSLSALYMKENP